MGKSDAAKIDALIAEADLTAMQEAYLRERLKGLSTKRAAVAAGFHPDSQTVRLEKKVGPLIRQCLALVNSGAKIMFDRAKAHELLMGAYRNAATAGEQVAAVREMIKLHGLAAPTKVEHKHVGEITHDYQVKQLSTPELIRLARLPQGIDIEGEFTEIPDAHDV